MPDLRVKRVFDPPEESDGARILVDRLWPRGLRKEDAALSLWLKEAAPSTALRQWFGHDPARWVEFERRYRDELRQNDAAIAGLEALLQRGRVTLLYAARDTEHNHALVLASFLHARLRGNHNRKP
jgi:uncharacterized protein YeaO (DUF488 family)